MRKIIRLSESDLTRIVKRVLLEGNNVNINNFNKIVNTIYNSRNNSWRGNGKKFLSNYGDVTSLAVSLVSWVSKHPSYNPSLLLGTICIILRESKGTSLSFLHPKEIYGFIANMFGGDTSQGYAQVRPSVAKSYNINPNDFKTLYGSIDGAYKMLSQNYETAKKFYQGDFITINSNGKFIKEKAINGDAALHLSIAVHNAGLPLLDKWCETNIPGIANKCNITNRKPYPDSKPKLIATTNKSKPLINYFPNKGNVYNYMPEVIQNFNSFLTLPPILNSLKNVKGYQMDNQSFINL